MNQSGLLRCARYAAPPNKLSYCGPDQTNDLAGYLRGGIEDRGLSDIMVHFQTLYPYLTLIASENRVANPFDYRVVEAYWLGNSLLNRVSMRSFYGHLADSLGLKRKLNMQELELIGGKIPVGALPHHAFHVFNIFKRTGDLDATHTVATMDACRISWGKVIAVNCGLLVTAQPLERRNNKLVLGCLQTRQVRTSFVEKTVLANIAPGDWVSFHWHEVCEVINQAQVANLEYYTKISLRLAKFAC